MNRRDLLKAALLALLPRPAFAATVSTLIGNGSPGFSDSQVNNPYGVIIGRDGGLYFCDLDNQRIRRFDFKSPRRRERLPATASAPTGATADPPRRDR